LAVFSRCNMKTELLRQCLCSLTVTYGLLLPSCMYICKYTVETPKTRRKCVNFLS